jgi:hypothetical protein
MFGAITKLWSAIANLTNAVESLAATTVAINQGVRSRCLLDAEEDRPALPSPASQEEEPVTSNGRKRVAAK